ncbi:MAG: cytochrome c biogenesis protein ResB [Nitrospirae bacterium]|nr:cytochrome c biogenesis protein ResB [Nitrospirota bacterium]MDA8340323.1 cytochrome c biogenesis protein ResB [Nitrospiraceae bacterium]
MKIIERFFKTITKPKFVITLIILTLIATFIGVIVPQVSDKSPSYFEEWKLTSPNTFYIVNLLQLNRVYTSVWFLSLVFIIMLSLGYSLYSQVRRNLKRKDFAPLLSSHWPAAADWDSIETKTVIEQESLIRFMRRRRYFLKNRSDDILVFSKNSINRWGGVIFHSGLFLIIIAALIGLAFQKRGFVQVMEGEVFSGIHDDFLVKELGVFQKRFDVGFKTQLYKFNHEYWETDQIKDISSSVNIIDKDGKTKEKTINVNSPLKYNGINIYQSFDYGYALTFILKRPDGSETVTHFLLDRPDRRTKPFIGSSDFPRTPYIFKMKFYSDISMNSFRLGKPILYLQVLKGVNNIVFDGLIIPGNMINIEGNLVKFFNISHWSGLIFAKDIGIVIVYAGFIIAVTGIIIIYMLPYKEIRLTRVGDSITSIHGTTKRYHAIFEEEMNNIKAELGVKADE